MDLLKKWEKKYSELNTEFFSTKGMMTEREICEVKSHLKSISSFIEDIKALRQPPVSGIASFDAVKRIWNAAENYTMHELGEICKGDAAYCEDVPDLETYFDRHYR